MNKISSYDRVSTKVINLIGGSLSTKKTKKLLDNLKAIREGSGKISIKSSIFVALENKANKTKNSDLKNKINYEIAACILSNKINDVEIKTKNLNEENKKNIKKLDGKDQALKNISGNIVAKTTKVSKKDTVSSIGLEFRLQAAINCREAGIDKEELSVIRKDIRLDQKKLDELKRIKEFISVTKAAYVLRGLNNNYLSILKNKEEKNNVINEYSNRFERIFTRSFLRECFQMDEIKTVYSMTRVEEFSQTELYNFDNNPIFNRPKDKLKYNQTVNLVNKKIERVENNIAYLEKYLACLIKDISKVEIITARDFIEKAESSKNKGMINQGKELKAMIQRYENHLKEVDDAPKKIAVNSKAITTMNEVKEILVVSYDNASHLRFMSDILEVMKMGNTVGQAAKNKVQTLQNEVESTWNEAISVKEKIDQALSSDVARLNNQNLDDIIDDGNSSNNNNDVSFQLPEVPAHDLADKIPSTKEQKAKEKMVG
ncbi:hypothetical protein [Providencia sneebia]|uniref:Uncharacterized protein n=1 Tax=Providencia sneebia DSM 19967 TaxID=1141660 RepID=K8W6G4_9GAMM|nr:hypothetical protein [Providencia sneebia]EKT56213.1 hypothetical protein OO7_09737 [Providencia sneebia DSM 19967]